MEKTFKFLKKNSELIKKVLSIVFVIAFLIFTATEMRNINFKEYHRLFSSLPYLKKFALVFFGLITFLFSTQYDFILAKYFDVSLNKKEIFKISFITQSFNNFISFGGITGTKLRSDMLIKENVEPKNAIKISTSVLISGLLGLFFLILPTLILVQNISRKYIYILGLFSLYIPFYFLAGKFKIKRFEKFIDENSPYSFLDTKVKIKLLLASILDWVVVSMYFSFIIKMINPEMPFFKSIFVYIIAEVVALISFIPGGIGSFDLTVFLLFKDLGYQSNNILVSILLFRITFYLVPWVIGIILYVLTQFKEKSKKIIPSQEIILNILSTLIFLSGAILIISTATPAVFERVVFLKNILPRLAFVLSKSFTLMIGVILIVMSRGIKFRIKKVYKISLSLLILGSIGCVVKGLDYEEAIILLIFAGLLFTTRDLFTKEHLEIKQKDVYKIGVYLFIVLMLYITIYNLTHHVNIYTSQRAFSFIWIEENPLKIIGFLISTAILLILFLYSRKQPLEFSEVSDEDINKYANFLKDHSGNYFSHLYFMRDKNFFLNSKKTVLMQYRPYKDNIVVLGDPVGIYEDFEEAIDEIIEFAGSYGMKVSFYEVRGENLELYANQGFSFIKIGEDATVYLNEFSYDGKKNKNLRKQRNKLNGEDFTFEIVYQPFDSVFMERLREISDNWLNGKQEMGYSLGSFDKYYLNTAPIAILKDKNQEIIAFANLLPVVNTKKISIDLMRYNREKCKNNEMDLLFLGLFDWAKEEGYEEFYLGMAPLSNVGDKKYSNSKERIMRLMYEYGNKFYSFQGLRYYKEKFHPRWSGRYIIYKNDMDLIEVMISILNIVHRQK
ncbi:bifunctional lysylphosphatidylglycerol flippase/synthetase MprF [Peptoniphilus stercorisuis]|uniref:Phosphatidylglycerol lysyltransferase n=1 Tax=Peptoniphilus stercorisuis TaxID=1436965 RepID=A0ABS4KB07_9FIRM|nr:bifunctional lysylphosphatidylglycerol flippase/synthetase MprF [Peptoniphilus stercorisuis]MBP2024948.1 phosphatidylglycerol lysyltransferase [Peptoniphilus stercorisuis]